MSDRKSPIEERELPTELGERFVAIGYDRAPRTFGEWLEATSELLEATDVPTGFDAMCTEERTRHRATFDGKTRHVHCVLDTLLIPFVIDGVGPVVVRSRSPESGALIELEVSRTAISFSPETAIMSFGVASEFDGSIGDGIEPATAYELFCPYVNAFPSREAYERWAASTDEAVSVGLPMAEGYELARTLAEMPAGAESA